MSVAEQGAKKQEWRTKPHGKTQVSFSNMILMNLRVIEGPYVLKSQHLELGPSQEDVTCTEKVKDQASSKFWSNNIFQSSRDIS